MKLALAYRDVVDLQTGSVVSKGLQFESSHTGWPCRAGHLSSSMLSAVLRRRPLARCSASRQATPTAAEELMPLLSRRSGAISTPDMPCSSLSRLKTGRVDTGQCRCRALLPFQQAGALWYCMAVVVLVPASVSVQMQRAPVLPLAHRLHRASREVPPAAVPVSKSPYFQVPHRCTSEIIAKQCL